MSREPAPPPPSTADPPTIAGSTLAFSAASMLFFVGGVIFLPWAAGRWCSAIRAKDRPRWVEGRTIASGVAFLVVALTPMLGVVIATQAARHDEGIGAAHVIGPVGLTLLLVPLFVRLPIVLADAETGSFREGVARSVAHAIAAPIETLRFTVLLVGSVTLTAGVALQIAEHVNDFAVVVGTLAVLPMVWTLLMWIVSSRTTAEPPRLSTWMFGVLAVMFGVPFFLLVLAGGLATSDALPLTVVRDGRGVQHTRGVFPEEGPRGVLESDRFSITHDLDRVVVAPIDGERYEVIAAYPPEAARFEESDCTSSSRDPDWHAEGEAGCRRISMRGPDWEMELVLDASGARLDDGALDRALARVGRAGVIAVFVAIVVLVVLFASLVRVVSVARRVSGRDRVLRLEGTLELGERGAIRDWGLVVGTDNRVMLREGGVVLRLPESLRAVGVAEGARGGARRFEVFVACDRVPGTVTHRTADEPWPAEASLVIGQPSVIESESLANAQRTISRFVLLGTILGVIAHLSLSAS